MITAGELAQLRSDLTANLPDLCQVSRPGALVSDNAGGYTPGAPTTVATVACAVAPSGAGNEGVGVSRIEAQGDWVITLPALTDVAQGDQVVSGGRTFEVLGIAAPRSTELTRRVACRLAST